MIENGLCHVDYQHGYSRLNGIINIVGFIELKGIKIK